MPTRFGARGVASSLTLRCGAILANRLAKAALSEGLTDADNQPDERMFRLYRAWADCGAGLLITGNVHIDRDHVDQAGSVVVAAPITARLRAALRRWAEAGTVHGAHLWMQLSHAGRQTPRRVNPTPLAASAVPVRGGWRRFGAPQAMSRPQIRDAVERFAFAAEAARDTGFTGVQIHAAHGALLGQFLSPHANQRQDGYGGDLPGRARAVLEVVEAVRARVGPDFPLAVKINASDFDPHGFTFGECRTVAAWLDARGVDVLEVSGGDWERPAMLGAPMAEGRDAEQVATDSGAGYFTSFAATLRAECALAVMTAGGWRARAAMDAALAAGRVDVIALARPFCTEPDVGQRLLADPAAVAPDPDARLRLGPGLLGPSTPFAAIRSANAFGRLAWSLAQIRRLADGGEADWDLSWRAALVEAAMIEAARTRRRRTGGAP